METGEKVAEQIAAEGAVLLKNDGALPLASDVTKVNVFGWGSTQWLESGSGSGRVVSTDTGLLDALEAAGIDYNSELTDMYKAFQPERPYASNQVGTLNSWPEQSCMSDMPLPVAQSSMSLRLSVSQRMRGSRGYISTASNTVHFLLPVCAGTVCTGMKDEGAVMR